MCLFPSLPTLSGLEIILLNSLHCSFSLHLLLARSLAVLSFLFGWLIFGKNFGNEIEGFSKHRYCGEPVDFSNGFLLGLSSTDFFCGCLLVLGLFTVEALVGWFRFLEKVKKRSCWCARVVYDFNYFHTSAIALSNL